MREAVIVSTARTGLAKSHRGGFNNTGGAAMAGHAVVVHGGLGNEGVSSDLWVSLPDRRQTPPP